MIVWKQNWITAAAAGIILAAAVPGFARAAEVMPPASPSSSQEDSKEIRQWDGRDHHKHGGRDHEKFRMRRLTEAAQYFGIETAGKDAKQLSEELKAARKADEAKWKRFVAEQEAKHLVRLQTFAKKLGIATEGKDAKQLRKEIRERCKESRTRQESGGKVEAHDRDKLKKTE
ncbi:hypothetical protein [Paenibacillus nasutitermitis]|uniref:Uncharacterized protein n=1 Tax=Paenibacillus nasutitermitis TaxID=1652958 RepID=A0A916ZG31_9BACL|nr:hypothetical protein [Paenibacillus nasutitermitis]GGD95337.1 hypothetical protein GCM10010911_62540 [Paenibacillus nasutitermitis]